MTDREQVTRRLHDYFSDKETVAAAYLFGSVARGSPRSRSDVDVVDMQSVDPRLIHQVFVDKALVISRDTDRRVHFEVDSRRIYFDRRYYRQEHDRQVAARLKGMGRNDR